MELIEININNDHLNDCERQKFLYFNHVFIHITILFFLNVSILDIFIQAFIGFLLKNKKEHKNNIGKI